MAADAFHARAHSNVVSVAKVSAEFVVVVVEKVSLL